MIWPVQVSLSGVYDRARPTQGNPTLGSSKPEPGLVRGHSMPASWLSWRMTPPSLYRL